MQDVLAPAAAPFPARLPKHLARTTGLLGADHLADVVFVDQSPIGKTARSNRPVTWARGTPSASCLPPRRWHANAAYTATKFSFNGGDGRCPTCGGSGFEHVEMQFLSDVYLRCQDCLGLRYRPEVLEVTIERGGKC